MDPRLVIHNAIIGLVHPTPPWPHPLHDAGYRLARIEQPVGVAGGKVVVDLVLVAQALNAALCIECKMGTVQEEQAGKYEAMNATDLVQTGNVTLPNPAEATLDVAYAIDPEHRESTLESLAKHAPSAGVIEIGDPIAWRGPAPANPALRAAFNPPIDADPTAIPRLLMVDDASDIAMLAGPISNALHAAIVQGRDAVTVASLIEMACWGWPNFGRAFQTRLEKGIAKMLKEAAGKELQGMLTVENAGGQAYATVRLSASAIANTQAGELRAQRALRVKLDSFVQRATGRPASEYPGQLLLEEQEPDDEFEDDLGGD